jgi:formylglycine-generating enzyme required for sulfatase activity
MMAGAIVAVAAASSKAQRGRQQSEREQRLRNDASEIGSPEFVITKVGGIKLGRIPAGTFQMGSPDGKGDKDEHPQHEVRISRPFCLGIYEVTQAQYQAVAGNNPSWFSASGAGKASLAGRSGDQHPVEHVSWLDAVKFCNRLNELEGRRPFYEVDGEIVRVPIFAAGGYRLPTEAEWEHACGGDPADLDEHAWNNSNSGEMTHPVGTKAANRFGLFDMLGNVWEWCWDPYDRDYYKLLHHNDPTGPETPIAIRVIRGESFQSDPRYCRSATRLRATIDFRYEYVGFRLAFVP